MPVIYKYELSPGDTISKLTIRDLTPRFIHFGEQNGKLYVWLLVNETTDKPSNHYFSVIATGEKLKGLNHNHFLQSVQMSNGLVFHLFEGIIKG